MSPHAKRLFREAVEYASARDDHREHIIGAVGIRQDGAMVYARNGAANHPLPATHAEWRLCRKLDRGSVVYVARLRPSGEFGLARPCGTCYAMLKSTGVSQVLYTTDDQGFEIVNF